MHSTKYWHVYTTYYLCSCWRAIKSAIYKLRISPRLQETTVMCGDFAAFRHCMVVISLADKVKVRIFVSCEFSFLYFLGWYEESKGENFCFFWIFFFVFFLAKNDWYNWIVFYILLSITIYGTSSRSVPPTGKQGGQHMASEQIRLRRGEPLSASRN